jgi:predicted ATPase
MRPTGLYCEARRRLHARIANTLNTRFPQIRGIQPENLAHHYTEAGLSEPAVEWWGKAGERALQRPAYTEAIAHLERALRLARALADGPAQQLLWFRLQITYANALHHGRGIYSPDTAAAFTRTRACRQY